MVDRPVAVPCSDTGTCHEGFCKVSLGLLHGLFHAAATRMVSRNGGRQGASSAVSVLRGHRFG